MTLNPYQNRHIDRVTNMRLGFLLLFLAIFNCSSVCAQVKNEDELKKQADKYFEDEEYSNAYKYYSQLVSLYPKDPEYNYRLGVCMLFTEPDKKKPYSYLKIATNYPKDAPKDAKFYLGKTYHINYRFDDAIKLYEEYKTIGSQNSIKKLQVDREIAACRNGKRLLSNLSDLVIINKKQLNEADYFRSYDLKSIGGKLLIKPEEFKTSYDKKKKDKSIIYIPKSGDKIFISSFGESGNTGRDIYYVSKLPNGTFTKPVALPSSINTEYDEDYPFLHPNGNTLYFSSKGHNSMGGYDVFKSNYDVQTQTWSAPKNLDFPINSPDDDYLFVTDSLEKIAYFSTGRYSPYGKIDVLKVNTERRPMNVAYIKGTVVKEDDTQSLKSKITIKNIENGEIVGVFQAQDNGDYALEVPNGGNFIFTVETPGIETQSDKVKVPVSKSLKPYKQVISYDKKILKIINYFDGEVKDDNYAMMLDLIEKKAKLELNETEQPYNNGLKDALKSQANDAGNLNAVNTTNPTISGQDNTTPKTNNNPNVTNEQLLNIAKEDAKEAQSDAVKLKQEAQEAFDLATQKTAEATEKQKLADNAITSANAITEVDKRNEELAKANAIKEDAKTTSSIATMATNLAKKLEVDATQKQKEADLTNEYIKQLETVTKNKNNKEALTKLEQIQKELDVLSKQKNQSDELLTSLKAEIDFKQNEINKTENKNNDIRKEVGTVKSELKSLENDLANENDNSLKDNIKAQIREINADIEQNNTQLATNDKKIETLNNEIKAINKELAVASKILNEAQNSVVSEAVAVNTSTNSTIPKTTNNNLASNLSFDGLKNKYSSSVAISNAPSTKDDITKQSTEIKNYNKEISDLIALDKNAISKTNNLTDKKKLNNEIKNLEKQKTDNDKVIATNTAKLKQLDATPIASNQTIATNTITNNEVVTNKTNANEEVIISNTTTPITKEQPVANNTTTNSVINPTVNNETAITNNETPKTANDNYIDELTAIKNNLKPSTSLAEDVFAYNKYSDPVSKSLKENAQKQFDIAKQSEGNLNNLITSTQNSLRAENNGNAEMLTTAAEDLNNKAFELRKLSATKTGAEREKLIADAIENEKNATIKKLQASAVAENQNQQKFTKNQTTLTELQKLSEGKSSNELSQASMLADEAALNFKQAQKIRKETDSYPTDASKIGGYSNAQDKENEALAKQNKSIELYTKVNPTYTAKSTTSAISPNEAIAKVNTEVNKSSQNQLDAYFALSKANQTEIKTLTDNIQKSPKFISGNDQKLKDIVINADNLNKEAKNFIGESLIAKTTSEKAQSLLNANNKEIETLKLLNEANDRLFKTDLVSNNETSAVNTTTTVNETPKNNTPANSVTNTEKAVSNNTVNAITNDPVVANTDNSKTNITDGSVPNPKTNNETPVTNPKTTNNITTSGDNLKTANSLTYQNSEAKANKETAEQNLVTANNEEKNIKEKLISLNNENSSDGTPLTQDKISSIETEAENLSKEAIELRKLANSKTGAEKEIDLTKAKELDTQAVSKKVEAADSQQQLNTSTLENNKENLTSLAEMAKGKNIPELASVDTQLSEINQLNEQAKNIRIEANAYPNAAAKLGGYSNANEKEQEAIAKQDALLTTYKKYFSNFVPKQTAVTSLTPEQLTQKNELNTELNAVTKKQTDALTQLNDANEKEYKTRFLTLPQTNSILKTQAQASFKKSQDLKTQANATSDGARKKMLLTEATKNSDEAIAKLNAITNPDIVIKNNNSIAKNTVTTPKNNSTKNTTTLSVKGLEVKNIDAYTADKPIPIDEKMPDGLVFKVQIGAFKAPLPNGTFKGLTPVSAQTTPNGYLRYMAGSFEEIEDAAAVKNDLRKLGYADAFVVAYYNGQRVQMNDAIDKAKSNGKNVELPNDASAGLTDNANIPRNTIVATTPVNAIDTQPVEVTKELEQMNGLLFTVQIGVFSKQVKRSQLYNLRPIYTEKLPNGLYRYTAGIYNQTSNLLGDKRKVVDLGVKDAFVSAYYNAKRVPFAEGQKIQTENNALKMETENPIIFGGVVAPIINSTAVQTNTIASEQYTAATPTIAPFSNGITSGPAPTADNGVKTDDAGVNYKVQIGAYKNQVPNDVASKFLNIKTWPVNNTPINGLYIYTIGSFNAANFAKKLRDEAISVGITDAFIVVYKDGKKLYGAEATSYLNK